MSLVELRNGSSSQETVVDPNSPLNARKFIGKYEVIKLLGRGAFGTVKQGVDPTNGHTVS